MCANGWPHLVRDVDLFGIDDLLGSERMLRGEDLLNAIEEFVFTDACLSRSEFIPIAASEHHMDTYAMAINNSGIPRGSIVWFQGREVERYPTFTDFYLAQVEYNRQRLGRVRKVPKVGWVQKLFGM
jgi:hypothetical protein